jgi:shikimate dehydrogenase
MTLIPLQLGLIGYPLGHSLSPQLHHGALKAMDLPGEYRLYPVAPLPEGQWALSTLIERLRNGELAGLNVTIPHKPNVLPLLDDLTPLVRRTGSANTLFTHGGKLIGDTTDVPGFLADLESWLPSDQAAAKKALILGAGGSARAVAVALQERGWQITLAARRIVQARELAANLGGAFEILTLEAGQLAKGSGISLIVNTTPVGMFPKGDACPWPAELSLPEGAAVYDLIYNPAETALLRRARDAGLPARNGMGMLVEQAALSLERWSGRVVPRAAMWEAVL